MIMASKWDFNRKLINEIRKYEMIYNFQCKDYRKTNKKEKAWTTIALKLNADEDICKKRWRNLRDSYKKYLRNCDLNSSEKVKQWIYYEEMYFLEEYLETKGQPVPAARKEHIENEPTTDDDDYEQSKDEHENEQEELEELEEEEAYEKSFAYEPCLILEAPAKSSNGGAIEVNRQYVNSIPQVLVGEKSSTDLLFESLARKIKESNLMENEVNAIECKVMTLVYSEIENYRQN